MKPHQTRASAAKRGYDRAWRRLRRLKLQLSPLCECDRCLSAHTVALAEVVDHIIPIAERPDLRLDLSNLRSMTKRCHDHHTGLRGRKVWGCDVNGLPLDPDHHWNKSPATE